MVMTAFPRCRHPGSRGFTFIESLITIAIVVMVFSALVSAYLGILALIGESRARAGALSSATDRMEYIRSLSYTAVGTQGGVPAGPIPQTRTVILNGVTYTERVVVAFVDDPADGLGGADVNAIITDYKQVKIEYSWLRDGVTKTLVLSSVIVPRGIENTAGGGTIRVNVFDAVVAPVSGASVRFVNASVTPAIDTTRVTGPSGEAYLSGAPPASGYQIFVTKSGYSTDGTNAATTSNPSPLTPPIAVLENQVSTMNFQIDRLSSVVLVVQNPPTVASLTDSLVDATNVATQTAITISGGQARLADTAGIYQTNGSFRSIFFTPSPLNGWDVVTASGTQPVGTDVRLSVFHNSAAPTLVPDSDLPGNSAGFSNWLIDLSGLSPATYPELALGVTLSTTNTALTPRVDEIMLRAVAAASLASGVPITVTGQKEIGTGPVYKYSVTQSTSATGSLALRDIEWDTYTITPGAGLRLQDACPSAPLAVQPNVSLTGTYTVGPAPLHSVRVVVTDAGGVALPGSAVTVSRPGYAETLSTSRCGQVFFTVPSAETDYTVSVSRSGYTPQTLSAQTITGDTLLTVILTP
jgi:prepilin-type N-terminal cleavage/methylation domain-containing protein